MFTLDGLKVHEYSTVVAKPVSAKRKSWQGQYCCIPLCHNSSGRLKVQKELGLSKLSFHAFPDVRSVKNKRWIKICHDPSIGQYTGITVKPTYFCHTEYNSKIP